jgi:hypothetical protein
MSSYISRSTVTQNSLASPSEKLVKALGTLVTLMEHMMAEVAPLSSVEQQITVAIKNRIDFE